MNNLLKGMQIVEVSAFIAAPYAGLMMGQMGADVIRIDPVGGGLDYRRWPVTKEGLSLYWAGLNKGKRSIMINVREAEGREIAHTLMTRPDPNAGILLTNLPARGWLDYEGLRKRRDDLIMANVVGNRDGSVALDYTVNAAAGFPLDDLTFGLLAEAAPHAWAMGRRLDQNYGYGDEPMNVFRHET